MKQLPCEKIIWYGIPVIRRELAFSLINQFGLSQKEAAEKLDLTPAAISQYLSKKRGRISILDEKIINEIKLSAKKINEKGETVLNSEICNLCKILKSEGFFKFQVNVIKK
jgi:predicted transcriptional regulator